MRRSSSRQLVGCVGEALYRAAPGTPAFAIGISGRSSWPTVLMGTMLLGKGLLVPGMCGQSGLALSPPGLEQRSVKFPVRSAADGTATLKTWPGTLSLRHSCDQKKKVFVLSVL